MARITFLLGGAGSGKSSHAVALARAANARVGLVATARALDPEMAARIRAHRAERPAGWITIEEPEDLTGALDRLSGEGATFCIVDCLTLWLGQLVAAEVQTEAIDGKFELFLDAVASFDGTVVIVSNEVGSGIVPDSPMARRFRDLAGRLHKRLAQAADRVVWMVAGIPHVVKGEGGGR